MQNKLPIKLIRMIKSKLSLKGIYKAIAGKNILSDIGFTINSKEIVGLLGPNGAGKTTFMDIVTGKTRPDEGRILWGDKSISLIGMSEAKIARAGIGRKFQKPTVFEDQTVRENLLMALKKDRGPLAVLFYKPARPDMERDRAAPDAARGDSRQQVVGEVQARRRRRYSALASGIDRLVTLSIRLLVVALNIRRQRHVANRLENLCQRHRVR